MSESPILIVEDDADLREAIVDTLELANIAVKSVDCAESALIELQKNHVSLIISDINMPGMDGHALLKNIKYTYPEIPVVLMTAYGSVDRAVDAMKNGASDYIVKPFKPKDLITTIKRFAINGEKSDVVAEDPKSQSLFSLAARVAKSDATVLITGESGTGKEVMAQYIHAHSVRTKEPFVAINCAAIPENMLEAILFGYEKGAFTGAYKATPGKFEQANGGTILLDEVTELDLALQAKLLRVLQEREVERIGGAKIIKLDIRILATTNRELHEYVKEGKFREDLYYRLNVFPIQWMPLRERPKDIVPLAKHLVKMKIKQHNSGNGIPCFSPAAKARLTAYNWPGNVRELDNVVERALILHVGSTIEEDNLHFSAELANQEKTLPLTENECVTKDLNGDVKNHEYKLILDTLKNLSGNRKQVAVKLGISDRTLRYKIAKMRELGWSIPH